MNNHNDNEYDNVNKIKMSNSAKVQVIIFIQTLTPTVAE